MSHSNRPYLSFLGLLVSFGVTSNSGCRLETNGNPPDDFSSSTGNVGGSGGIGGEGGMGASGGGGMGGGSTCVPDATRSCYTGMPNTTNIGTCKAGIETCLADGSGYGPCEGEVVPVLEDCVTAGDQDCDGLEDVDETIECLCTTVGADVACDTGMSGVCAAGMGQCASDGRSVTNCTEVTKASPENCATPVDDDCNGTSAPACTGDPNWTFTHMGMSAAPFDDAIYSVAATPDGGYVIVGVIDGTIGTDGLLVTAGKAYVAKLDAMHVVKWEKTYTAATFAVARSVAVDKNGNIVISGQFSGNMTLEGVDLVSGTTDAFLLGLKADGALNWVRSFISTKTQNIPSVAVDSVGNVYITGSTDDPVDFGGGMATTPSSHDIFLASYTAANVYRWHKVFVNGGAQYGRAIATTPNDDVVFIGDTDNADVTLGGMNLPKGNNFDFVVGRYGGTDGAHQWSKLFGKAADQLGRGISVTKAGDILLTGGFAGTVDWKQGVSMVAPAGTTDVYVAKLAGDGTYITHKKGNAAAMTGCVGTSVAADDAGNVTVFGSFAGSIDFGAQPATSTPTGYDTFLVKLKADDWTDRKSTRLNSSHQI